MKTNDLTGAALDWAVAKCEGLKVRVMSGVCHDVELLGMQVDGDTRIVYSNDWALAGPIIQRERIATWGDGDLYWEAECGWAWGKGPTPLIAAMRCYVTFKLGDEVEVPEELKGVTA